MPIRRAFPQEIVDIILDMVALGTLDDDPDLVADCSNCTVVSKAWLPRASKNLFKNQIVVDYAGLQELSTAIRASSRLATYVSSLKVDESENEVPEDIVSAISLLRDIVPLLHALDTLSFVAWYGADEAVQESDDELPVKPATTRALKHLEVTGTKTPLTEALLGLFPAVDTLTVRQWFGCLRFKRTQNHVRSLVVAESCTAGNSDGFWDVPWLLALPHLKSLVVDLQTEEDQVVSPVAINELVKAAGKHIRHFELILNMDGWDATMSSGASPHPGNVHRIPCCSGISEHRNFTELPSLSACASLRTVTVRTKIVGLIPDRAAAVQPWQQAVDVLASVPPHVTRVQVVTFICFLQDVDVVHRLAHVLDWPRVERAMEHCTALQSVDAVVRLDARMATIALERIGNPRWKEEAREAVAARLGSQFRTRFALRFEECQITD